MERIRKVGTTLRNNWKKSIFFSLVGGYGLNWYDQKLKDDAYMRELAREAVSFGSGTIQGVSTPTYNVTVILNPVASGGKARKLYEKYCAPLLHLAGMKVSVVRTESEGEAMDIMEIMADADAVLVAGGDGTLMEAVTGLLRRKDKETAAKIPIGVLPVGKTNTLAHSLFGEAENSNSVRLMGEAAMSVVRQLRKPLSVIEVENRGEDEVRRGKKIYCVNNLELGAWKDARLRCEKYWLFGFGLKHYVTYLGSFLTGYKEVLWDCDINLQYVAPGNTDDIIEDMEVNTSVLDQNHGWLSWLRKKNEETVKTETTFSEQTNEWKNYGKFNGTQITIEKDPQNLKAFLYNPNVDLFEFVSHGFNFVKKSPSSIEKEVIESPQFYISPITDLGEEDARKLCMDGDEIPLAGPVLVSLLKDQISVFCTEDQAVVESQPVVQASPKRWSSIGSSLVKQRTF